MQELEMDLFACKEELKRQVQINEVSLKAFQCRGFGGPGPKVEASGFKVRPDECIPERGCTQERASSELLKPTGRVQGPGF